MQGLLKNLSFLTNPNGGAFSRRHFHSTAVVGIAAAFLLVTSSALFAELTTVALSPLVYQSTLVAPLENNKEISVLLALPSSDPTGLAAFVKQVSTPGEPLYHQYLTPQQFAEKFGGNATDYAALKNWAAANGLVVSQESAGPPPRLVGIVLRARQDMSSVFIIVTFSATLSQRPTSPRRTS